jgi:hypothetical protein
MTFKVIQGGRAIEDGSSSPGFPAGNTGRDTIPCRDDVLAEAECRIKAMGYETWRNRHTLTGAPVPRDISYRAMQIRFAAEAIGRLADIPADFRSDIYWPA